MYYSSLIYNIWISGCSLVALKMLRDLNYKLGSYMKNNVYGLQNEVFLLSTFVKGTCEGEIRGNIKR